MSSAIAASPTIQNQILHALPEHVQNAIIEKAECVHLGFREIVFQHDRPIPYVYFPETGVISTLVSMDDDSLVEIASVGNESVAGLPVMLGVPSISQMAFCQVEGTAWRVPANVARELTEQYPELRAICQRAIIMLFELVSLNVGCYRNHTVEQRCARWLLRTHDRCQNQNFNLTQEFLSRMIGVSRTVVNSAATNLSKQGLLRYARGKITIVEREKLERCACPCYRKMNTLIERVFENN
ncbi:MAG TPA: Crp/Fnr family transcriptional regulator [Oculatellaceae cyanobacterium]